MLDQVTNTTIGGTTAGAGNLVSGNIGAGIVVDNYNGTGAPSGVVIEGNQVGTNAAGTAAIPNQVGTQFNGSGIEIISAPSATIGGTAAGAGNLISGNAGSGVYITGSSATGNFVEGNYIGTDKTGNVAIGNVEAGVSVTSGTGNTIGGATSTAGTGAGNLISGNGAYGIFLGVGAVVEGNLIGTNANGTAALGNGTYYSGSGYGAGNGGIYISAGSATDATIGGTAAGDRNVISGNLGHGIDIVGGGGNLIEGNYVGLDINGTTSLPNLNEGVVVVQSSNNTIGGLTATPGAGAGNVISGNSNNGGPGPQIQFDNDNAGANSTTGNKVEGNLIGTNASGTAAPLGTNVNSDGVLINFAADGNTVGGTISGAGNVISANLSAGVQISQANNNLVEGNWIGLNVAGTAAVPNQQYGVQIDTGATGNTIGGTATGAGNVVSGNTSYGIHVDGATTIGNIVSNNYVGTGPGGSGSFPNNSGALTVTNSAIVQIAGTFNGNVSDAGTLDLAGNNVSIVGALTGSGIVTNSAVSGTGTLTLNGTGTFGGSIQDGMAQVALTIAGGTVTLTGNNGYSGSTTIDIGDTLEAGISNAFSHNSSINDAGTLDLGGFSNFIGALNGSGAAIDSGAAATLTVLDGGSFNGNITGTNTALTVSGSNQMLTLAGNNTYSGLTTIGNGDTLQAGSNTAFSANSSISDDIQMMNQQPGTLDLNGHSNTIGALTGDGIVTNSAASGSATLTVNGTGTFNGVIQNGSVANVALTIAGGTVTLSGANTYTGSTTINIGATLQAGSATALTSSTNVTDNGTIDLAGSSVSIGALTGSGTITNSAASGTATLTVNGTGTFNGVIQNGSVANVALTIAGGTVTLSGANTYTGTTTVSGGTLLVNGSITSAVTVNSSATLSGNGTIIGSVNDSGTVDPGTVGGAGTLTIQGNYVQNSGGKLTEDIGGATAGTQYNQIIVTGTASLAGTLNVCLINGYLPTLDSTFPIMTFASSSGDFATKTYSNPGGGNALLSGYTPASLVISVVPVGTTVFWSSNSGSWSTASNWSTRATPSASDHVYVGPNVTVTHSSGTDTITSLTADGSIVLSGGTLTINGSLQATTPVSITGGTLANADVASSTTLTGANITGTSGVLDGVTLAGTLDLSKSATGYIRIADGLTLSSGTVLIGTAGDAVNSGDLEFDAAQTLGGTGTVIFGGSTSDTLDTGNNLTISSGVTIHGQNGTIGGINTKFTNHGTINADVAGGNLTVSYATWSSDGTLEATNAGTLNAGGVWTNTGLIAANVSTLDLGGGNASFTLGSGTTYDIVNSTVNITGTLQNTGQTLTLNASTGSWNDLGDIIGGTITTSGGAVLRGASATGNNGPGYLDGVTFGGTLDLSKSANGYLGIDDGLTLNNASILIGTTSDPVDTVDAGFLFFYGNGQSFGGTGTVTFGGSVQDSIFTGSGLTIGSGITIHGQTGYVGYNPNVSFAYNNTFTNQGTIDADVAGGEISLQGALQSGYSWSNTGTVEANNGATLRLMGNFSNTGSIAAHGGSVIQFGDVNGYGGTTFTLAGSTFDTAGGTVLVEGTLNNTGSTLALNSTTGSWVVDDGEIQGGTITTANGAVLLGDNVVNGAGTFNGLTLDSGTGLLDGVTLAGTLDLSHSVTGNIGFRDGLTLSNGTILIGTAGDSVNYGVLFGGSGETLGGTGTLTFGASVTDSIYTGTGLTIGSGITIQGQTGYVGYNPHYSIASGNTFTNQGTIDADVAGGTITLLGTNWSNAGTIEASNGGTLVAGGTLNNLASGTLTGGTWEALSGGIIAGLSVTTNAATLLLDGSGSHFYAATTGTTDGLAGLSSNTGSLTIQNGANVTETASALASAGSITIGSGSTLSGVSGSLTTYTQTAGSTVFSGGTLDTGTINMQSGFAQLDGTITTSGAQTYDSTVVLGGNTTLVSTGSGNISFAGTVDGPYALAVNTAGTTTFDGTVGGGSPLASLATDQPGQTFLGASVTTFGNLTINDPLTITANVTLIDAGPASTSITLGSTVESDYLNPLSPPLRKLTVATPFLNSDGNLTNFNYQDTNIDHVHVEFTQAQLTALGVVVNSNITTVNFSNVAVPVSVGVASGSAFQNVIVTGTPVASSTGTLVVESASVATATSSTTTTVNLANDTGAVAVNVAPTPTPVVVVGNAVSNTFTMTGTQGNNVTFEGGIGLNVFVPDPSGGFNVTLVDPSALSNTINLSNVYLPTTTAVKATPGGAQQVGATLDLSQNSGEKQLVFDTAVTDPDIGSLVDPDLLTSNSTDSVSLVGSFPTVIAGSGDTLYAAAATSLTQPGTAFDLMGTGNTVYAAPGSTVTAYSGGNTVIQQFNATQASAFLATASAANPATFVANDPVAFSNSLANDTSVLNSFLNNVGTSVSSFLSSNPTTVSSFLGTSSTAASSFLGSVATSVSSFLGSNPTTVSSFLGTSSTAASSFLGSVATSVSSFLGSNPTTVSSFLGTSSTAASSFLGSVATSVSSFLGSNPTTVSSFLGTSSTAASSFLGSVATSVSSFLGSNPTTVSSFLGTSSTAASSFLGSVATSVSSFLGSNPTTVSSFLGTPSTAASSFLGSVATSVSSFLGSNPTTVSSFLGTSSTAASSFLGSVATSVSSFLGSNPTTVSSFLGTSSTAASSFLGSVATSVSSFLGSNPTTVSSFLGTSSTAASSFLGSVATSVSSFLGSNPTTVSSFLGTSSTAASSFLGSVSTSVSSFLGSNPTTVSSFLGTPSTAASSFLGSVATSVSSFLGSNPTTVSSFLGTSSTGQSSFLGSVATSVSSFLGSNPTTVSSFLGTPSTAASSFLGSVATSVSSFLGSNPTTVSSFLGTSSTAASSFLGSVATSVSSFLGSNPTTVSSFLGTSSTAASSFLGSVATSVSSFLGSNPTTVSSFLGTSSTAASSFLGSVATSVSSFLGTDPTTVSSFLDNATEVGQVRQSNRFQWDHDKRPVHFPVEQPDRVGDVPGRRSH